MKVVVDTNKLALCRCNAPDNRCHTHLVNELKGDAFCVNGAPKLPRTFKMGREETQCDCVMCELRVECVHSSSGVPARISNFEGNRFCLGDEASGATEPQETVVNSLEPITLTTDSTPVAKEGERSD